MKVIKQPQGASSGNARLDPKIARLLESMGQSSRPDIEAVPIEEALALMRVPPTAPPPPNSEDLWIDAGAGREIRLRLYRPEDDHGALPVLMHLHGGGFVTGSVEMDDARCCRIARDASCIVVSVDYSLAPEHPFPEPVEDAFAAWQWIIANAAQFDGDARRVAISGSSAGGHLAVGVCLLARDRPMQAPLLQLLTYPVIDPDMTSASYREFADGPSITRSRMAWFIKLYAGQIGGGALWSPLTGSLAGMPPAHVITAECDVLRDEGEEYAARLHAAGVRVTHRRYDGMVHGYLAIAPDHPKSTATLDACASVLRGAFGRAG